LNSPPLGSQLYSPQQYADYLKVAYNETMSYISIRKSQFRPNLFAKTDPTSTVIPLTTRKIRLRRNLRITSQEDR